MEEGKKPIRQIAVRLFVLLIIFAVITAGTAYLILFIFMRGETEEVVLPDVRGKSFVEAFDVLNKAGLKIHRVEEFADNVPEDRVVWQEPAPDRNAGTRKVKKGRTIELCISKGTALITVPDLREKTLTEAKNLLRSSALKTGDVVRIYSDEIALDCVISQNPGPYTKIKRATPINILLSKGSKSTYNVMPDLIGKRQDEAKAILDGLGIATGRIEVVRRTDVPEGTVLDQDPKPSVQVPSRESVSIVISGKREVTETPQMRSSLFEYAMPKGLSVKELKIMVTDLNGSREVHKEKHKPGDMVRQRMLFTGSAVVRIYVDNNLMEERKLE